MLFYRRSSVQSAAVSFQFILCQIFFDIFGYLWCVKGNISQNLPKFPGVQGEGCAVIAVSVKKICFGVVYNQRVNGAGYVPEGHPVNVGKDEYGSYLSTLPQSGFDRKASSGAFRCVFKERNAQPDLSGGSAAWSCRSRCP